MKYRRLLPLLLASACVAPSESESTQSVVNARTVISLTFDDTLADQFQAGDMLAARGMRGTFYVNSPRFDTSGYMTKAQVIALEQQGHEIAGHTLDHANLPTLSDADARNEICNDRAALLAQGFRVTSFAYPFGADNSAVQGIVRDCGYNSARDVGGLMSTTYTSCQGCPWTNPVPPANLYMIRTNDSIHANTTLQTMQQYVIDAENNGGGYVPIVMHHICDGCNADAVTAPQLAAFLDWLQQRGPATQVGTVDMEIGGSVQPAVTYPPSQPSSTNLAKNPSLETDADGNQVPDCWQRGGFGTNTSTFSLVTDASDGVRAQRIQISSFSSGGRRLVTAQDAGACAPAATVGHRYTVTAFYKSDVAPRFTVYYRNASGTWQYWAESPSLPTSTSYRQATYTTPATPSGATAISVGLTIYAVGTITMDQFSVVDIDAPPPPPASDTVPPSATILCNGTACSPNPYSSPVSVSLSGWDFSGIRQIRYTTNGSDPATSGTVYSSPFTVSTNTTVRALVTDNANNATTLTKAIRVGVDTTPPTVSITCNGTACAPTAYSAPVSVSLSAADASGIRDIRYTTDGRDPATFGTVYTAPFTVSSTTTVRAIATDNATNAATATQTITISADTTPPALSIACNGATCQSTAYAAPVSVSLTATDASGIRDIRYTTDGSDPATSGLVYSAPFTVSSTTTVRAIATDNANNATALSQTIQITVADTTPPTLSIACNGTTCSTSPYSPPVSISLAASDASGIRDIRYTTNGSDPATAGTIYTAPFTISATTTVRAIATDNAGNTTTLSQTIAVGAPADTTPPSLSIACNGVGCSAAAYTAPVSVTLSATDASGIRDIRYTTNGSDPATSGTVYTSPFTVSSTTTVRAVATDNAGNATTLSQTITITAADTTPPTLSIACNGGGCASTFTAPVSVTLSATDASGIREIRYTTNGSDPTTGTLYTGAFTVSASATVRATAVDNPGNRTSITQAITISSGPANLLQNASLEIDANGDQIPDCWKRDGYGTNTRTFTLTSDAFDGARAQKLDVTAFSSGGGRLASAQDSGACAPAATPGRTYTVTAFFKSNVQPKISV
ncbi:MAG TPA: chitobiase/beta-hexosaminidase C-terminal domain-containing protein [Kofleriaceae bacterium]|nr:chitobiase/beta-hexosaminidase C-terminal domain-containing protein [Kofleriaceae bacterium]